MQGRGKFGLMTQQHRRSGYGLRSWACPGAHIDAHNLRALDLHLRDGHAHLCHGINCSACRLLSSWEKHDKLQ